MIYINQSNRGISCTHPKVVKIHRWGGVGLTIREQVDFITISLDNGKEKTFRDTVRFSAIQNAENWLKRLK